MKSISNHHQLAIWVYLKMGFIPKLQFMYIPIGKMMGNQWLLLITLKFSDKIHTRWCPPTVISWFVTPMKLYRYIYHKPKGSLGVNCSPTSLTEHMEASIQMGLPPSHHPIDGTLKETSYEGTPMTSWKPP